MTAPIGTPQGQWNIEGEDWIYTVGGVVKHRIPVAKLEKEAGGPPSRDPTVANLFALRTQSGESKARYSLTVRWDVPGGERQEASTVIHEGSHPKRAAEALRELAGILDKL